MKGNISKKKGLLSEMTNDHLDYISDKLYGKVGITREDFEKLKEETAQEYNDLAEAVVSKEDVANKSTTIDDNADDVKYPTTKAVKVYADKSKERAVKEASELIMKEVSYKQDIGNMFGGNLTDFLIDLLGEDIYPNNIAMKYYVNDKLSDYYTKEETDSKIGSVFKYCGTVEFAHELPNYKVGENIGHVYNISKSNDDLDESLVLSYPTCSVKWYGKMSLIDGSYYLTIKDKNGNDITQSVPKGITLYHDIQISSGDVYFATFYTCYLVTLTDNGWLVSHIDAFFNEVEDKNNIDFTKYRYDILEPKAGDNVVWNGYYWDILSGTIDLSNYYTKEEVNELFATKEEVGNIEEATAAIIALQNSYIGGETV